MPTVPVPKKRSKPKGAPGTLDELTRCIDESRQLAEDLQQLRCLLRECLILLEEWAKSQGVLQSPPAKSCLV